MNEIVTQICIDYNMIPIFIDNLSKIKFNSYINIYKYSDLYPLFEFMS